MDGYCDGLRGSLTGWDLEPKGGPPLLPILSELETHQGPFISVTQAGAQLSLPRRWSLRGQTNKKERVKRPWPNPGPTAPSMNIEFFILDITINYGIHLKRGE